MVKGGQIIFTGLSDSISFADLNVGFELKYPTNFGVPFKSKFKGEPFEHVEFSKNTVCENLIKVNDKIAPEKIQPQLLSEVEEKTNIIKKEKCVLHESFATIQEEMKKLSEIKELEDSENQFEVNKYIKLLDPELESHCLVLQLEFCLLIDNILLCNRKCITSSRESKLSSIRNRIMRAIWFERDNLEKEKECQIRYYFQIYTRNKEGNQVNVYINNSMRELGPKEFSKARIGLFLVLKKVVKGLMFKIKFKDGIETVTCLTYIYIHVNLFMIV
ncbi:hypothetical protein DICPUDRAFT_78771 [Dictyostelium purpureum]|uniref:Uncharacterized protein n=1 Tax=Dictyostelium purpureum TaxID=5786 RepID=F0ZKI5_DICPU|nr:uncharacterized protein DICPUDRAFT_78771 [Dictyostelium purpureum]EGC35560.1 hypothetical protein DICPUDRAFT_78771 [Dictyostelium purpureum]|eukprot:XP_003287931.1 hypothetical protein DICPUDRAFT_78771 [Dictyostelium purpureum]